MHRGAYALWTLLVGLVVGFIGTIVFYGQSVGLSVPLFTLVVIAAVLWSARKMGVRPRPRNLWPLLPLLFFAGMVAVRADPTLSFFNLLAVLGLGALALHYLPLRYALDEDTTGEHVSAALRSSVFVSALPVGQAVNAAGWVMRQQPVRRDLVVATGRGLLLTVPVVLVFAALLGAADTIFASRLNNVWNLFGRWDVDLLTGQGVMTFALAWAACGALAYAARREPSVATATSFDPFAEPEAAPRVGAKKHPFTLGMIEAGLMLGAVNLLFIAFVLVQFTYFFGGDTNISLEGLTYAQYARRGFFELVAVSVLTLGLILWLDWVTIRQSTRHVVIFRVLAVLLIGLTGVLLASASQRMALYEQAFGYTHLRVYTHMFMRWLAVLFVVFLLALFRLRERVFSLGTLLVVIGYLVTLNVMNVDQYIAERNVERYLSSQGTVEVDVCYLRTLSVDALPAMLTLYHASETRDPDIHQEAAWWLEEQARRLEGEAESVFALHLAREQARVTLADVERPKVERPGSCWTTDWLSDGRGY